MMQSSGISSQMRRRTLFLSDNCSGTHSRINCGRQTAMVCGVKSSMLPRLEINESQVALVGGDGISVVAPLLERADNACRFNGSLESIHCCIHCRADCRTSSDRSTKPTCTPHEANLAATCRPTQPAPMTITRSIGIKLVLSRAFRLG
jgi:hypothetical protein